MLCSQVCSAACCAPHRMRANARPARSRPASSTRWTMYRRRWLRLLNGAQHVGVIAINLVYPVLVFRAVDTPVDGRLQSARHGHLVACHRNLPAGVPLWPGRHRLHVSGDAHRHLSCAVAARGAAWRTADGVRHDDLRRACWKQRLRRCSTACGRSSRRRFPAW